MLKPEGDGTGARGDALQIVYVGDGARAEAIAEETHAEVRCESRGTTALDRIEDGEVDCVVAEDDLPSVGGPEFLGAVGELYPGVARVMLAESVADAPSNIAFVPMQPRDDLPARVARRVERAVERLAARRERDRLNDRVETLVEESPDPILTIDDECEIVFANNAIERVFGREPDAIVGESALELIDESVHDCFETAVSELCDDEGQVERDYVELPGKHRDGREVPLAISFRETERDDTNYFSAIVRDVSKRKRLEDRLEAEKRKTKELHEVAVMLEECETPDEVCRLAVETAEQLLEFDLCVVDTMEDGELVPRAVSKGVPTDGYYTTTPISAEDNLAARAYREGESLRTSNLHDEGVDPAESGYQAALTVPIGDIGVFQAVSQEAGAFDESDCELAELLSSHVAQSLQRIRSESALQAERDRFAALFENVPEPIIDYGARDGRPVVHSVNEAFEEVFGYEAGEAVGREIADLIVPDERRSEFERHVEQMKDDDHLNTEVRRQGADGMRDFLLRTASVSGERSGGYAIYTDITDRKQLERDLERANRKFEELHHVAVNLEGLNTADEIYDETVAAAEEILQFDICGVAIEDDGYLVPQATTSEFDEDDYKILRTDEGIAGKTYQHEETYVIEDIRQTDEGRRVNDDLKSFLSVPLGKEGVLQAGSRALGGFDDEDAKLAELLVSHASEALQRVRSESALREERDRFAALFENVPEPTVRYELRDGDPVIKSVNEAFEETFGYSEAEARGESIDDLLVPDDLQGEAGRLNERVRQGERVDAEVKRTADGGVRDFLLRNAEVSGDDGNYVIYTDITERKQREEMLDALHRTTRDLMSAERQRDICETAVETARNVLDIPHATVFRWDDDSELLEPFIMPEDTITTIGEAPALERGEGIVGTVFADGESAHLENAWNDPRAAENGSSSIRAFGAFPLGDWGVMTVASAEVGTFDDYEIDLVRVLAANTEVALNRAAREAELADQRSQLAELDRINEVIRDVDQLLVRASTREEMEQAVCDRLAESAHYRFAWTGKAMAGANQAEPSAFAGVEEGYLEAITEMRDETPRGPAQKALETAAVQVVQNVPEDDGFAPWREQALERGYRSAAAIPLRYRETVYGVLCVYADRANAFDDREQAVLAELGETIGHAINAAESKKALLSDAVVEVEFEIRDGEGFFARIPREEGGEFALDGVTMTTDGSFVYFMTAEGIDPDRVLESAESADDIGQARLVNEHDDGNLFEFVYTGPSPLEELANHGGTLRDAKFTANGGRSVVELPRNVDVRSAVESIQDSIPGTKVVARRERERPERTVEEFRATLEDDLTERQRSALDAAYYAGFFEWPRESTGEEVSESLGVSAPTFHQHLRVGERKLLSAFLDE
ncbi:GAF domain-containing protein [Halorussus lipolyticus]|uniref:GAF domain-containing protein n=1 Tax=Halorussus lipolyticus TaxID=3034024 RepID=UPI0023E77145|nr:GAF domain-containing protein [Halorussus sp. DT80]